MPGASRRCGCASPAPIAARWLKHGAPSTTETSWSTWRSSARPRPTRSPRRLRPRPPAARSVCTRLPLDGADVVLREITLTASYSAGPGDMRAALELIATGRIDPRPLVSHRLPLTRTGEALELQRRGTALKVVVQP